MIYPIWPKNKDEQCPLCFSPLTVTLEGQQGSDMNTGLIWVEPARPMTAWSDVYDRMIPCPRPGCEAGERMRKEFQYQRDGFEGVSAADKQEQDARKVEKQLTEIALSKRGA